MVDYTMLPYHMREVAQNYVENGVPPGSFLSSVLKNDFLGAFINADAVNTSYMREWANWIYNEAPDTCHGNHDRFEMWIEKGGLNGGKNES